MVYVGERPAPAIYLRNVESPCPLAGADTVGLPLWMLADGGLDG